MNVSIFIMMSITIIGIIVISGSQQTAYAEDDEEGVKYNGIDDWVGGITPEEDSDADRESDLLYLELCDYYGGDWKEFDREDSWYDGDCKFKDKEQKEDYIKALCDYHEEEIPAICKQK